MWQFLSGVQEIIILGILCPAYLFMAILFIAYTCAILNDVLIFDAIKTKAPEFVGHSNVTVSFYASSINWLARAGRSILVTKFRADVLVLLSQRIP